VDPQQEFVGKNLLYVARSVPELSAEFSRTPQAIHDVLDGSRVTMYSKRLARPRPHLDDKVLTSWNGLMIAAFARAARVLSAQGGDAADRATTYLDAATRAATFLKSVMWSPDTATLLRRFRDGHAAIDGYAEDYAYLIFGLLELFQSDSRASWLEWAVALQRRQDALFWDEEAGGWFSTTGRDPSVLLRMKDDYDGAEPAASSVSVMNLLVLSHLHDEPAWVDRIERTLELFAGRLEQVGRAVPMMSAALSAYTAGLQQVVVVGTGEAADALRRLGSASYRPFTIVLGLDADDQQDFAGVAPFLAAMRPVDGSAVAYVCERFTCHAPVTTPEALALELAGVD
jgi:uncharacterized protein YyaL (SSP411 family)